MKQVSTRRQDRRADGTKTDRSNVGPASGPAALDAAEASRRAGGRWFVPAAVAMVVVGTVLRFLFLGDIEFKGDETIALVMGRDFLEHPHLVTHGMLSSVNLPNPPASVYFFAVAYGLGNGDPTRATVGVIAWNAAGLALFAVWLARTRRRTFGAFWCLWALGLLCLNPWAVIFSRKIWAQDLLPPLVIGGMWCLEALWSTDAVAARPRRTVLAAGILLLLVASQVHMSGILWMLALATASLVRRPPLLRRDFGFAAAVAAVAGLALYAPWLVYLAGHRQPSGMPGWSERIAFFAREGWIALKCLGGVWQGQGYPLLDWFFDPAGSHEAANAFFGAMGPAWRVVQVATGLLFIGAWLAAADYVCRSVARRESAGPTQWWTVGLAAYFGLLVAGAIHVYPFYAIVALPAAALALARGLERAETRWLTGRAALRCVAVALLAVQMWTTLGFLWHIHGLGPKGTRGDYGAALHFKEERVRQAIETNAPAPGPDAAPELIYLYQRAKGLRPTMPPGPAGFGGQP